MTKPKMVTLLGFIDDNDEEHVEALVVNTKSKKYYTWEYNYDWNDDNECYDVSTCDQSASMKDIMRLICFVRTPIEIENCDIKQQNEVYFHNAEYDNDFVEIDRDKLVYFNEYTFEGMVDLITGKSKPKGKKSPTFNAAILHILEQYFPDIFSQISAANKVKYFI